MKTAKIILPNKMYFTIGEVEKIIRVKAYTIRFWEKEINVLKIEKGRNGRRRYKKYDIEKILKIKDLLYEEGMTIDGVNKYFRKKGNRHIDKKPDKAFEHTILEYVVNELKNILESFD